jgi:hypothetical protein
VSNNYLHVEILSVKYLHVEILSVKYLHVEILSVKYLHVESIIVKVANFLGTKLLFLMQRYNLNAEYLCINCVDGFCM